LPRSKQRDTSTLIQARTIERIVYSSLSLRVIKGFGMDDRFAWEKGRAIKVGRGNECDLQLHDTLVSRVHFHIEPHRDGIVLRDAGSKNGTFVKNMAVLEVFLESGCRIVAGNTTLLFEVKEEEIDLTKSPSLTIDEIVGSSPAMRKVVRTIEEYSRLGSPVLITGETGTGKELVAMAIHKLSKRAGPLVRFSGASASLATFESELFGHIRGAYTGADWDRIGAFREADGGTLFLDEIHCIPMSVQPRLLHALDHFEVKPLGSDTWEKVSTRVIAATNLDLSCLVDERKFYLDLFYRLCVLPLNVPPLREHLEDLPELVARFTEGEEGRPCRLTEDGLELLKSCPWPGNVRELKNVLERCLVYSKPETLSAGALQAALLASPAPNNRKLDDTDTKITLKEVEIQHIMDTLYKTAGNKRKAAKLLGISETALHAKLNRYGLR
jgi:DNA-binding NtrC family response regulator